MLEKLAKNELNIIRSVRQALVNIKQLPGLLSVIYLAFAVNLIVGVLLAASAAIYTGTFAQNETEYALLQMLGVLVTIVVLLCVGHVTWSLSALGVTSFLVISVGGIVTGMSQSAWLYLLGFLLIVGFDKMIYCCPVKQCKPSKLLICG